MTDTSPCGCGDSTDKLDAHECEKSFAIVPPCGDADCDDRH